MTLKIETHGNGAVPMVFFHGWGFDSQIWQPIIPLLTPFATVYLVDLPGYGYSDHISWDAFVATLSQRLPPACYAVGWSLGGAYAMRLALEAPLLVKQFIAISASPKFIAEAQWPGITAEAFDTFMSQFAQNPEKTLTDFLKLQAPHRAHLSIGRQASVTALEEGLAILKSWDAREALKTLNKGAFVFGRLDAIVPATTHDSVKAQYPQFDYLLLNDAAHAPFLSHSERVVAYLKCIIEIDKP
ncbi:MAG: alpha/beta fold hydrolase [Gammaproteobacteria bacterium]|nr:alpha/beta fold hydrolase [Gammaproteobacteria bacterium]